MKPFMKLFSKYDIVNRRGLHETGSWLSFPTVGTFALLTANVESRSDRLDLCLLSSSACIYQFPL